MLAKILSLRRIAEDCFDMHVAAPLTGAAPGRFVHIAVPGSVLRRPISLCDADKEKLRLVFAVRGEGTLWLSRRPAGTSLDIIGALGNGFPENGEQTLLVGGGIGLPPLLYYASRHRDTCHTLAGFRNAAAVILNDEFPSIQLFTDDGSAGVRGFPTDVLHALLLKGLYTRVFTCGPVPLMQNTARICREAGVPCYVSMEERMACGVGACLCCSCAVDGHYKRVCRDGPVFNGEEVSF